MGWMVKIGVFFVGLVCLTLGLWPISLVCFGYLGYTLWSSLRNRRIYVMDKTGGGLEPPRAQSRGLFRKRYIVAALFFILALVAGRGGGTYSPYVFLSIGVAIVLSGVLRFGPAALGGETRS